MQTVAANIDRELEQLRSELNSVEGTPTEIYARIVGYYRAVKNWNRGKKEEYKYRQNFSDLTFNPEENGQVKSSEEKAEKNETAVSMEKAVSYTLFVRTTCPKCPPVKALLKDADLEGKIINADTSEGFTLAAQNEVFAAPTVIFTNSNNKEIFRSGRIDELRNYLKRSQLI